MTNTYRRTMNGQRRDWLPSISEYDVAPRRGRFGHAFSVDPKKIHWLHKNPHRRHDVGDWFYWMTEPSHWNHDYSTVPRRAEERRLLRLVLKSAVDADDLTWPLPTKPHTYHW